MRPLLGRQHEGFAEVYRHAETLREWFLRETGWMLEVDGNGARLFKRPADLASAFEERRSLAFARTLVATKIRNTRVFLRRNFKSGNAAERDGTLEALSRLADRTLHAATVPELLGIEGDAAARYFRLFSTLLGEAARDFPAFAFEKRTRRPPADAVNAMLSLGYALLTRTWLAVLSGVGFDPISASTIAPASAAPRWRST
jgi:CRISP-associated protein Cas1